jgi:thioesterase domain-containing protein
MGGTIALEMAQQLCAQGHSIGLVALLETYNWAAFREPSSFSKAHHLMQKLDFHLRNLFVADSGWTFLREKAKVARNRSKMLTGGLQAQIFDKSNQNNRFDVSLSRLWEINDRAAASYRPKAFPGRLTSFIPRKHYAWYDSPEFGWENVAEKGVDLHMLPVYPAGMMVEPFVKRLASELKNCICNAAGSGPPN